MSLLLTWGFKNHPKHAINKSSSLDDPSQFTQILRTTSNKNAVCQTCLVLGNFTSDPETGLYNAGAEPSLKWCLYHFISGTFKARGGGRSQGRYSSSSKLLAGQKTSNKHVCFAKKMALWEPHITTWLEYPHSDHKIYIPCLKNMGFSLVWCRRFHQVPWQRACRLLQG